MNLCKVTVYLINGHSVCYNKTDGLRLSATYEGDYVSIAERTDDGQHMQIGIFPMRTILYVEKTFE